MHCISPAFPQTGTRATLQPPRVDAVADLRAASRAVEDPRSAPIRLPPSPDGQLRAQIPAASWTSSRFRAPEGTSPEHGRSRESWSARLTSRWVRPSGPAGMKCDERVDFVVGGVVAFTPTAATKSAIDATSATAVTAVTAVTLENARKT